MKKIAFLTAAAALAALGVAGIHGASAQSAGKTLTLVDASSGGTTTAPLARVSVQMSGTPGNDLVRITDSQGGTCDIKSLDRRVMLEWQARALDPHVTHVRCTGTMSGTTVTAELSRGAGVVEID